MVVDPRQVERFLYREARLMDAHRHDEWLALWDADATYWVPCRPEDVDPAQTVSVIYDRRGQLKTRIERLKRTPWLKEAPPRLQRLVSNIEIEADTTDGVVVQSAFILAELHRHEQTLWAGQVTHTLLPAAEDFRIRAKKVVLLNCDEPLPNLLFLL